MSPGTPPRSPTRVNTPTRSAKRKAHMNAAKAKANANARRVIASYKKTFFNFKKRINTGHAENAYRYKAMMNQLGANYKRAAKSLGFAVGSRIVRGRTAPRAARSGSQDE